MIGFLIGLYSLVVIVYFVLQFLPIPANKWTEMVRELVEPALDVVRTLMDRYLPQLRSKGFDWSPVVLYIVLRLIGVVLGLLSRLPLIGWLF